MTCQLLLSNNSKVMCNNFSLPFPCKLYATQEILSCINRYLKITTVNKLDNQIIKQLLHGVITKHHISVVQIIFLPQPSALSCSPITNNDTLSHNIATMASLHYPLSWKNQIIFLYFPPTSHKSIFRKLLPLFDCVIKFDKSLLQINVVSFLVTYYPTVLTF